MEYLLSHTSVVTDGHTELAQTLERTPAMDCSSLRSVANRAVAEYFSNYRKQDNIPSRVRQIAQNIVDATSAVHEDLSRDDESDDDTNPDDLFETVNLRVFDSDAEDRIVDRSLQDILDSMDVVTKIQRDNMSVYLFRIATSNKSVNLVTELYRQEFNNPELGILNPLKVTYNLHFAGYDVE